MSEALAPGSPRRSSTLRRLCVVTLGAVAAAGCGARSELGGPAAECTQLEIGLLGNQGAYNSLDFDQWLSTSGAGVKRAQTTADEPLTAEVLEPFDVVVLDWLTRDYTPEEAAVLADWIAAGGGVASMTGYDNNTTDDWHANSLLAPIGVAYGGPLLNGPVTELADHPITKGITSVVFEGGYAVTDLGGDASTRTPVASLSTGAGEVNVGYAIKMGDGRAFVWGDEWIEFTAKQDMSGDTFPPKLWVQMFKWISPRTKCLLTPPG